MAKAKPRLLPPFHLRPNKFVDRMMFVDLISHLVGDAGPQSYRYVSMGATFLPDHHLMYRRAGIEDLLSFGNSDDDLKRQMFNRPTGRMSCIKLDSADLAEKIEEVRKKKSLVIWLDYMAAAERRTQLQQVEQIAERLEKGDVIRVTLNSEYRYFGAFDGEMKNLYPSLQHMAAGELNKQIEEYLPAALNLLKADDLPRVLAAAIQAAVGKGLGVHHQLRAIPLLSTTYADGDRMVTAAFLVHDFAGSLPQSVSRWRHRSKRADDLRVIEVPDLSLREKFHVDRKLNRTPSSIYSSLPFRPTDQTAAAQLKAAISSYKAFHRYYPDFHHMES